MSTETFQSIYSISSARYNEKYDLEESGFIILPQSLLSDLINKKVSGVYTFRIENELNGSAVYAGVREFSADEGKLIAPSWMMSTIGVSQNQYVKLKFAELPTATRTIFQPLSEDFNKISNPKIVLEKALRAFPCLNQGSIIPITFAGIQYEIKILKTEPLPYVSIRKADVDAEFAPLEKLFEHQWNVPDTDSSADEEDADEPVSSFYYIKNNKLTYHRHSTMASRERDLKSNKTYVGVKKFVDGEEILPPKPKVKVVKKKSFIGHWANLKNEKGVITQKVRDYGAEFNPPVEKTNPNDAFFKGSPHFIAKK